VAPSPAPFKRVCISPPPDLARLRAIMLRNTVFQPYAGSSPEGHWACHVRPRGHRRHDRRLRTQNLVPFTVWFGELENISQPEPGPFRGDGVREREAGFPVSRGCTGLRSPDEDVAGPQADKAWWLWLFRHESGVDHVTFDIILRDRKTFERIRDSDVLNAVSVARSSGTDVDRVTHFSAIEPATAIKFTIRRLRPSGSSGEGDKFGHQFHTPLFSVMIPWLKAAACHGGGRRVHWRARWDRHAAVRRVDDRMPAPGPDTGKPGVSPHPMRRKKAANASPSCRSTCCSAVKPQLASSGFSDRTAFSSLPAPHMTWCRNGTRPRCADRAQFCNPEFESCTDSAELVPGSGRMFADDREAVRFLAGSDNRPLCPSRPEHCQGFRHPHQRQHR